MYISERNSLYIYTYIYIPWQIYFLPFAQSDGTTASPARAAQRVSDDELDATHIPLALPKGSWRVRCAAPIYTHKHVHTYIYIIHIYTFICIYTYVTFACTRFLWVRGYLTIRSVFAWQCDSRWRTCAAHTRASSPSRRIPKWNYELWAHEYYIRDGEEAICETLRFAGTSLAERNEISKWLAYETIFVLIPIFPLNVQFFRLLHRNVQRNLRQNSR